MKELKEESRVETREDTFVRSRRGILKASAALLVGGLAGRLSTAYAEPAPQCRPGSALALAVDPARPHGGRHAGLSEIISRTRGEGTERGWGSSAF